MWMKLARSCGTLKVDEMLEMINAKESQEWSFFNRIEPFPEDKIIFTLGYIAAIFANAFMKRKDKVKWTERDFIPKFGLALFEKPKKIDIVSSVKNVFGIKLKKKEERRIPYALEAFVNKNKGLPKRLKEKK